MRAALLILLIFAAPFAALLPARADDGDKGFLTRMIEDALSSDDQKVSLDGFEGVLSSRARFAKLTITDAQGVWLTIEDAALDWSRSALLGGRLEVNELSAASIDLERLPPGEGGGFDLPSPTSRIVTLPDLPVSVHVGRIAAQRLRLGPSILGEALEASIEGSLDLDAGDGAARLEAVRTDGREGRITLDATFSDTSRVLRIALDVTEAADGVTARLLGIPDRPALAFGINGNAPVSDFTADIRLVTGGAPRLSGTVRLGDLPGDAGLYYGLDLAGNVAALVEAPYREFFGGDARLKIAGEMHGDGSTLVDRIEARSQELDLAGSLVLAADGLPERFDLAGNLHPVGGGTVLLPIPGEALRVGAGEISARYDAGAGEAFSADARFEALERGDLGIGAGHLAVSGSIRRGTAPGVLADVTLALDDVALPDAALAAALGRALGGSLVLDWTKGTPPRLERIDVQAGGTRLTGSAEFGGPGANLRIGLSAGLAIPDLAPWSGIAGEALSGTARADLEGWYEPLGGAFDVRMDAATTSLRLGEGIVGRLVEGDGTFAGGLARGLDGTRFDGLRIETPRISMLLDGRLGAEDGEVAFDGRIADVAVLGLASVPALQGPAVVRGQLGRTGDRFAFDVTGSGPAAVTFNATGTTRADLSALAMKLDAALPDAAPLLPGFAGPVSAKGQVTLAGSQAVLDLATDGPEGARLGVTGEYALDTGLADLAVTGSADLALADRFAGGAFALAGEAALDLRMQGAPVLASLTGTLGAAHARVSLPGAGMTLPDVDLEVRLDPARAPDGGFAVQVSGRVARIEAPGAPWAPFVRVPVQFGADVALAADGKITLGNIALGNADARVSGRAAIADEGAGRVVDANLALAVPSLSPFGTVLQLPLAGSVSATLDARMEPGGAESGVPRLTARLAGNGGALVAGNGPIFGLFSGDADFSADLALEGGMARAENIRFANRALALGGSYADGKVRLDVRLDSLGRLVPRLPGPVSVTGTIGLGNGYALDLEARGPAELALHAGGRLSAALIPDLAIRGTAGLGILNAFLSPGFDVQGALGADLTLTRSFSLAGLAGTLTATDGRAVITDAALMLTGIDARARIAGGEAEVTATGAASTGGTVRADGRIGLLGPHTVAIGLALENVGIVKEPTLRTSLDGTLRIDGALTGGGRLSGSVTLGPTEIALTFTSSAGSMIDVAHVGLSPAQAETLRRAGLRPDGRPIGESGAGPNGKLALDVKVAAPNRVFIRGRGLDAELGGTLQITGRAGHLVPAGKFELIRGRFDVLGRRLDLAEASLDLQGNFDPKVRLVATTAAEEVQIRIVIAGNASAPVISLESEPALPEDQILALLLFGKAIDKISPLQALQLTNAVATLIGPGGEGLQGKIRKQFGLDDLDVSTDSRGNVALKAGKYLTENVYSDLSVNSHGDAQIELNLDLTPSLTVRGSAGSGGSTALGIFFEKDY